LLPSSRLAIVLILCATFQSPVFNIAHMCEIGPPLLILDPRGELFPRGELCP
jgi:hypothetical protein